MAFLSDVRVLLLIALVLAAGIATINYQRAQRFKAERDGAVEAVFQLNEAVKSKDGVIDDLMKSLQTWQDRATQSAQASQAAGNRAETYNQQLSAARARIRALMEADRGSIECLELAAINVAAACPNTAASVREWATGDVPRPLDREARPGGSASGPETDAR